MTNSIVDTLNWLQLKRVAHFTPSKNLFHIIQDGQIRSSKDLADRASEYFAPTDLERFDRHPDKTCVSFTYPNGYYLSRARKKPQYSRFPDWVCLLIQVRVLERSGVLFSLAMLRRGGEVRTRRRGACGAAGLFQQFDPIGIHARATPPPTCGYRSSGRSADTRSYSVVRPNRDRRSVS